MQYKAQNIINNMIENDRIKFIESIIKKNSTGRWKMPTKIQTNLSEKKTNESHNQFDIDYKLNYKNLVPILTVLKKTN